MKVNKKITTTLALASASLIGTSVQAENEHDVGDWDISAALLFYNESDDRVQAIEPIIQAKKHIDTDETLTLKFTYDSLTGASPTGAVASNLPQTFTQPSGNGDYVTAPGEYPIDDTFLDTRIAFSTTWDKPIADHLRMSLNSNISFEYDYRSIGVGSTFAYDTNNNNTTYTTGLALAFDQIEPEGDIPIAFGVMQPVGQTQPRGDTDDDKFLIDVLFGVTQVINKYSLFQVNYSLSISDGYLNDPYKIISVVGADGVPLFENGLQPDLPTVLFENRPDTRVKNALYGQYKRWLRGGDVVDASYRLMVDDWGITSHTLEAKYRFKLRSDHLYLQPHLRIYQQSEADFFTPFFIQGQTIPVAGDTNFEASSDTRLGEFTAYTVGFEIGSDNQNASWSAALEYYLQQGDEPSNKFGELVNQELFPDVDALMLRLIYDF